jgi:hypothetical protein
MALKRLALAFPRIEQHLRHRAVSGRHLIEDCVLASRPLRRSKRLGIEFRLHSRRLVTLALNLRQMRLLSMQVTSNKALLATY